MDSEMKKFYLSGIEEENERMIYDISKSFGPIKLYTSYVKFKKDKIKSTGTLSIIRNEDLTTAEFESLKEKFAKIGITFSHYFS